MNTPNTCPKCGAALGADSPEGLCPACLVAAALAPGDRIEYFGNYELIEEIGAGGMGLVWKARQVSLNRIVALKMIRSGTLANDEEVRRFLAEAEAAGQLQHPGIVAIHEIGTHEGQHYFTMDYIAGKHLGEVVDGKPLEPRQAARYAKRIAEAVQHAHSQGILHRDLKPHNVMLDERDQPRVTDFGLAKRVGVESGITLSVANLGSPSYMSPEQARGESSRVSAAADVYSLGAILYEMLTGRPPFQAASAMDTMRQVIDAEPAPPRRVNPAVPRDIETICLRCLEKQPARRYASAQAFADECGRFLNGEPIHARPVGVLGRGVKWAKRRPVVAGLTGAVAMLLLILAIVIPGAALRIAAENKAALQARNAAFEALREAEQRREESRDHFARSLFEEARAVRTSDMQGRKSHAIGAIQKATLLLAEPRKVSKASPESVIPIADLRSEVLAALLVHDATVTRSVMAGGFSGFSTLDLNGRLVAGSWIENVTYSQFAKGDIGKARAGLSIHNMLTGETVKKFDSVMFARSRPAFSSDGKFIALPVPEGDPIAPNNDNPSRVNVVLHDLTTWEPVKKLPWPEGATVQPLAMGVVFSPDGKLLASNPRGSAEIILWNVEKGVGEKFAEIGKDAFGFVVFTPDSKHIIFPSDLKQLVVRDVTAGTQKEIPLTMRAFGGAAAAHTGALFTLQVAGDAPLGTSATTGARVVLDWQTGEEEFKLPLENPSSMSAAAFSTDGRLAYSDGPLVKIMDLATGRETMRIQSGNNVATVEALAWDSDMHCITSVTSDGIAKRWELNDTPPAHPLRAPHHPAQPFEYSPDGEWLAFVHDGDIQLRSRRASHQHRVLAIPEPKEARSSKVSELAFRADGAQLAVVRDGRIFIFDVKTGALLPWEDKTQKAGTVAFAPDGHLIAGRMGGVAAFVEDVTAGRELWNSGEKGMKGLGQSATVCADGRHILNMPAFGSDAPVRIIELATGRTQAELHPHSVVAQAVRPKAASRIALSTFRMTFVSFQGTRPNVPRTGTSIRPGEHGVIVFDSVSGAELADYPGAVLGTYSGDDRLLALGYTDGAVELRNGADGALLLRWMTGSQAIMGIAFAPDANELTIGDRQNPLKVLDIAALRKQLADLKLDW